MQQCQQQSPKMREDTQKKRLTSGGVSNGKQENNSVRQKNMSKHFVRWALTTPEATETMHAKQGLTINPCLHDLFLEHPDC